jgi:nicotinamidase-related amidase
MISYKGRQIPETFGEIVNPLHTALIVHEMRNDLREIGSFDKHGNTIHIDFDSIVSPIARLLEAARDKNVRVIYAGYIGHSTESLYSDVMVWRHHGRLLDPKTAPAAPGAVEKSRGWQVIDELRPRETEIILAKPRVDCFIGTNLELLLRWNGIRTIVIAGVGAEVGILPTTFHAINLGFFVVAPPDCIRGTASEWTEDAMKFIGGNAHGPLAIVQPSSDVIAAWERY